MVTAQFWGGPRDGEPINLPEPVPPVLRMLKSSGLMVTDESWTVRRWGQWGTDGYQETYMVVDPLYEAGIRRAGWV